MISFKNTNIGLIGLGYWGKIILRNLRELGYTNIVICEKEDIDWHQIGSKHEQIKDYRNLKCDKVFVIVPVESHYEVCSHFLKRGIDVFCEKPLDTSSEKCIELYKIAEDNNANLFVDWIFTYNSAVLKIKQLISEFGKPKSIIANRMNFGPVRHDVGAKWDLASHDVSIGCYLLNEAPKTSKWLEFNRNQNSIQYDSAVGILNFSETNMQINVSWFYGIKNRMYIFEFEDFFIHWDDTTGMLLYRNETLPLKQESPLHNSINNFMSANYIQKDLTINITKSLEGDNICQNLNY